jgi:putative hydrolase of the HAD superfamily
MAIVKLDCEGMNAMPKAILLDMDDTILAYDHGVVGDNFEWEVAAPQMLGIKGVWIDHKGRGVPPAASVQPFLVIRQLSDLLSAL